MEKIDSAALALVRMRGALLDLAEWANNQAKDANLSRDGQRIADQVANAALALALDDTHHAPF